jgi:hypothetical protein
MVIVDPRERSRGWEWRGDGSRTTYVKMVRDEIPIQEKKSEVRSQGLQTSEMYAGENGRLPNAKAAN